MFHAIKQDPIMFKSNPPLEPRPVIELTTRDDGSPINLITLQERDNRGLCGAHYDPSTMSLRARLARGIELTRVDYDITENDPNKLQSFARNLSVQIIDRASSRVQPDIIDNPSKDSE